jgi:hypothetical protein
MKQGKMALVPGRGAVPADGRLFESNKSIEKEESA